MAMPRKIPLDFGVAFPHGASPSARFSRSAITTCPPANGRPGLGSRTGTCSGPWMWSTATRRRRVQPHHVGEGARDVQPVLPEACPACPSRPSSRSSRRRRTSRRTATSPGSPGHEGRSRARTFGCGERPCCSESRFVICQRSGLDWGAWVSATHPRPRHGLRRIGHGAESFGLGVPPTEDTLPHVRLVLPHERAHTRIRKTLLETATRSPSPDTRNGLVAAFALLRGRFPRMWQVKDSNLRRLSPTDLQSAPIGRSGNLPLLGTRVWRSVSRSQE